MSSTGNQGKGSGSGYSNNGQKYAWVYDGNKPGWMINDDGVMRKMDDEEKKEFKKWYNEKYYGGYEKEYKDIIKQWDKNNNDLMKQLGIEDTLKKYGIGGSGNNNIRSSSQSSSFSSNFYAGGIGGNINVFVNGQRILPNAGRNFNWYQIQHRRGRNINVNLNQRRGGGGGSGSHKALNDSKT